MLIDPADTPPNRVYAQMIRAITPRPIAWVSTRSKNGVSNLAPFSYFSGVGSQPASLMFSVVNHPDGRLKDTTRNIRETQQFVVNVVPFEMVQAMSQTAANLEFETSEFEAAGLTEKNSLRVNVPAVAESPIQFECRLLKLVPIGEGPLAANVIIGEVLLMQVDDQVLDAQGKIDPERLDLVGRMGGLDYCRTRQRFELPRP